MKKKTVLIIGITIMLLCVGCGAQEKTDNVSAGMEAVRNLEYETALGYFQTALGEKEDERQICRGMGLAYMGLSRYKERCF